jgi:hypothetical protein
MTTRPIEETPFIHFFIYFLYRDGLEGLLTVQFLPAQQNTIHFWNKSSVESQKCVNFVKSVSIATMKKAIEKMFEDLPEQFDSQTVVMSKQTRATSSSICIVVDWNVALYCFEKCKID